MEKQIIDIIGQHVGGTYEAKQKAVEEILILFSVSGQLPIDFVKWYSGMEQEKILKAYERWIKESGNLR